MGPGVVGAVGVPGGFVGLEVNDKVGFWTGEAVGVEGDVGATATAAGVRESFWDSMIHHTPATIPPPSKKAKTAKMIKTPPLLEDSSLGTSASPLPLGVALGASASPL